MSDARSAELNAAYAYCRAIAKREAKNFYYAFVALPKHKSDAMCAVYAFMRKADDLADDEEDKQCVDQVNVHVLSVPRGPGRPRQPVDGSPG